MTGPRTLPILVAVDGSEGSKAAIRYGADEALRLDRPLRLVHVALDYLPIETMMPLATPLESDALEKIGEDILKEAREQAEALLPADRVSSSLAVGERVLALLDAAADAHIVVLGDDRTPLLERIAVGSIVSNLAARSPVPVVSVPAEWDATGTPARIVLGIKDYDQVPAELLRTAFRTAHEQSATLELAYVWDLPATYGEVIASVMDYPTWQAMVDDHLRSAAESAQREYPDVIFETSASRGQPAHALRERSVGATLLLLARRPHGFPLGHFGATGRSLLRVSHCPVEVLPLAERGDGARDLGDVPAAGARDVTLDPPAGLAPRSA